MPLIADRRRVARGGLLQPLQKFLRHRVASTQTTRSMFGVLLTGLLIACADMPERAQPNPSSAVPLEQQLVVRDGGGTVSPATESMVLAGVKAEGRGDLAEHHLRVLAAAGQIDLYRGNAVRLLLDGPATFGAMKAAIARARHRVLLESYIVEDSAMADELSTLLSAKAAQGVQVAFIYDGVGSFGTDAAYFARLAKAGVAVCKFNPVNPLERPGYWGINHRDHRKVLVVDQEVAFTGGINISRVYSAGSFSRGGDAARNGWRDTHVELRGPVVEAFAGGFARVWTAQGCRPALVSVPARARATPGSRIVQVLESDPADQGNRIYSALLAAIEASQRRVWLTMAYFAPGDEMVDALVAAARRGVDVQLMLPGRSDFTLILHAGRSYYERLLEAGVRIHEMDDAVMHAKTAVIDGVLSTVGSSNMDWRSFVANSEVNAIVLGREFGQQLEAVFDRDRANSRAIELSSWQQRDLGDRAMEQLGRLAERLL